MKQEELKNGIKVCHDKHSCRYRVASCNMRMKDTSGKWIDAVVYIPLYENDYECFCREINSFLEEFKIVEE